jgi:hypothetical protein
MKNQKNEELKKKNCGILYKHMLINAKLETEVKKTQLTGISPLRR